MYRRCGEVFSQAVGDLALDLHGVRISKDGADADDVNKTDLRGHRASDLEQRPSKTKLQNHPPDIK